MKKETRKWIFIRGLARHSGHWGPFVDQFKNTFPEDEIELLDLRGNGQLAHSPSCTSIADNVRDLRARSKWIKAGHAVHLMTISLGSMIGTEWATLFPQEISGLVTINTSDKGNSSFFERMRPQNYLRIVHILKNPKDAPMIENEILQMTTNHLEHINEWAIDFSKLPKTSTSNFFRQIFAASQYEFPEHKPKTEVLILCSEGDQLVNPICTKRIAEMWTLKAHVHPTAGHDLTLEDPAWACQEIKNWLSPS